MKRGISKKHQALVFPILDIALNGLNYFFHIFISWYFIPEKYGTLNSLLSLLAILLVGGIAFQTFTAKSTAESGLSISNTINIIKTAIYFNASAAIILILNIVFMKNFTRASYLSVLLIIIIFLVNVMLSVFRGMFQGTGEFLNLNKSFYCEVSFKILYLFAFLKKYPSINTVLLSILFGMLVAIVYGFIKNRNRLNFNINFLEIVSVKKEAIKLLKIFIVNFFFYFFTSIDMLMVNYFLPEKAGVFAVILKYNQILQFATFSILTVFITILSKNINNKPEFVKKASLAASIIGGISFVAIILYNYVLPPTVGLFFGTAYSEAGKYLVFGLIPYIFMVFSFLIININVVLEKTRYIGVLLIATIIITSLLFNFHSSIKSILIVESVFYFLLMLVLLLQLKFETSERSCQNGD
ncbi:polysaccharide biosynthesis protein [Clostridium cellulovorans]|uniref:Polysaccharide biosynthesis protein n=1 Tax=Clostridium cellulovorans (strain ATCC 35296 / DSM 3052 / OCM 3 / 743B) TaxID=573061 RepID=D9STB2_CLOC7|nr:polysaccharide biosynthesis protein [Clostridium cellulovorans]ADL50727.1 polysaccharide biosynthesis protein [Clostridium cellulovorans 743B]